jgi:zinc transporter ZupT
VRSSGSGPRLGRDHAPPDSRTLEWVAAGFTVLLALDLLLEWHHCHQPRAQRVRPLAPLLLLADGLHNFLGELAIGAVFLVDIRAGLSAWLAAALHEVPQEVGDFGAIACRFGAIVVGVLLVFLLREVTRAGPLCPCRMRTVTLWPRRAGVLVMCICS